MSIRVELYVITPGNSSSAGGWFSAEVSLPLEKPDGGRETQAVLTLAEAQTEAQLQAQGTPYLAVRAHTVTEEEELDDLAVDDLQLRQEELIAAYLFDDSDAELSEEDAAQVGRVLLHQLITTLSAAQFSALKRAYLAQDEPAKSY